MMKKCNKKTDIKVSKGSYSYNGDEETMKALVAEHGAVVTGYLFLFINIIHL